MRSLSVADLISDPSQGKPPCLNTVDTTGLSYRLSDGELEPFLLRRTPDFRPHEYLKYHHNYRAAFEARLRQMLKNTADSSGPAGPFSQSNYVARFDAITGEFRRTFECELMRWGSWGFRNGEVVTLADSWETRDGLVPGTNAFGRVRQSRANLKVIARESRLLNDIPPPVISFSGGKAIITRVGNEGAIYVKDGVSADPRDYFLEPSFNPASVGIRDIDVLPGETINARIFSSDFDGAPAWSALVTAVAP